MILAPTAQNRIKNFGRLLGLSHHKLAMSCFIAAGDFTKILNTDKPVNVNAITRRKILYGIDGIITDFKRKNPNNNFSSLNFIQKQIETDLLASELPDLYTLDPFTDREATFHSQKTLTTKNNSAKNKKTESKVARTDGKTLVRATVTYDTNIPSLYPVECYPYIPTDNSLTGIWRKSVGSLIRIVRDTKRVKGSVYRDIEKGDPRVDINLVIAAVDEILRRKPPEELEGAYRTLARLRSNTPTQQNDLALAA